eukprot:m.68048 g.68048  ORF g.68048 m.68048 type:complete len:89 (+) comp35485_c0_seq3:466-732(+)
MKERKVAVVALERCFGRKMNRGNLSVRCPQILAMMSLMKWNGRKLPLVLIQLLPEFHPATLIPLHVNSEHKVCLIESVVCLSSYSARE